MSSGRRNRAGGHVLSVPETAALLARASGPEAWAIG
jgi:hypothetical protein